MAMTKKTVYQSEHLITPEQQTQVDAKIAELVADGVTDGVRAISVKVITRYWVDQNAAAAWEAWLTNFAVANGFDFSSFVISDI
jgi:hypothetical protein